MKQNKLSKGSNLLWEASRMMLPEHKEAITAHLNRKAIKAKPDIDEQKLEEIANILANSYNNQLEIKITVFNEQHIQVFSGIVTYLDAEGRYFRLNQGKETLKLYCHLVMDMSYSRYIDN